MSRGGTTTIQAPEHGSVVRRGARGIAGHRWWRELVIAAALYAVYDIIRGLIAGNTTHALRDGHDILNLERLLHIDPEHYLNHTLDHLAAIAVPACFFYATLHFIITPAVLIWTYIKRPDSYRRARTVLAAITLTALVGFWLFPTAPPRLLTGGGFQDTLVKFGAWGLVGRGRQRARAGASNRQPVRGHALTSPGLGSLVRCDRLQPDPTPRSARSRTDLPDAHSARRDQHRQPLSS